MSLKQLWLVLAIGFAGGASAGDNLIIKGDTVYDQTTQLTWQRCSQGNTWDAENNLCTGCKGRLTFKEAMQLKSGNGWRLPSVNELQTLFQDRGEDGLSIDTVAFPDTGDADWSWYWSSNVRGASKAGIVLFDLLRTATYVSRQSRHAVRLVKGGE